MSASQAEGRVRGHVRMEDAAASSPWETGYGWAQRLRERLDLDGDPLPTLETLADALNEDRQALDRAMAGGSFDGAALIDGVVTRSGDGRHGFAFRRNRPFTFCRALAEVLAQLGSDALLTRARSERQQRNRAFAAEFLAPSSGCGRECPARCWTATTSTSWPTRSACRRW